MITKIYAATPLNHNYYNRSNISFKGYRTNYDNIDIYSKRFDSSISSTFGNISIRDSKVNGNIDNIHGEIKIHDDSHVCGDIGNVHGTVELEKSAVTGNISSTHGKVILNDSVIDGSVTVKPENIELNGQNKINELILSGAKKATAEDAEKIKADLAKQGIFIGSIGHINNTEGTLVNVFSDGELKSSKIIETKRPLEFRLPKGNLINTIRFDADKQGVLILEKGTEFFGKLINGIIKRV